MFLFDTDHISIIQAQTLPEFSRLSLRMQAYPPTAFFYSIVSFHEQVLGGSSYINRARTKEKVVRGYKRLEIMLQDFSTVQVLAFDDTAAGVFDSLKAQQIRIGTMDLRIAAIALSRGFTVLTRNLSNFRKVPGLLLEDWTQ